MTKFKKKDSSVRSNESQIAMMDKVSKLLLIMTFLLAAFLAFGGADFLATNLGISKWIPLSFLMIAILASFTELYFKFVRIESAPREVTSTEMQ